MKFHYLDHDTDIVSEAPPVQNTWYEVFHAYDVRLSWCEILQTNTETAAKDIQIRWTIDGNVYFVQRSLANNTIEYIHRNRLPSTGGTAGLGYTATEVNANKYTDKRGQDFKVEVRIISALGTAQTLICRCVRETLELT